jgi:hypothetical protein
MDKADGSKTDEQWKQRGGHSKKEPEKKNAADQKHHNRSEECLQRAY